MNSEEDQKQHKNVLKALKYWWELNFFYKYYFLSEAYEECNG